MGATMAKSTRRDRFDKADVAFRQACADVNQSYSVWTDACDRLMRIGKERLDAWNELVDTVLEIEPKSVDGQDANKS